MNVMINQQHRFCSTEPTKMFIRPSGSLEMIKMKKTTVNQYKSCRCHSLGANILQQLKKLSVTVHENLEAHLENFQVNCEVQNFVNDQKAVFAFLSLLDGALQFYSIFSVECTYSYANRKTILLQF